MSTCSRCGAEFSCAMADGGAAPCWCTALPAAVPLPVPGQPAACWCPACLTEHIAALARSQPPSPV
ncbi:MAG: cysteine-rich CWC family protein [Pseudomonadota bacterium]|nr:cysteine-rich CWC family protein [Pseudomonadota bacterium]